MRGCHGGMARQGAALRVAQDGVPHVYGSEAIIGLWYLVPRPLRTHAWLQNAIFCSVYPAYVFLVRKLFGFGAVWFYATRDGEGASGHCRIIHMLI